LRAIILPAILVLAIDQASKVAIVRGLDLAARGAIDVWPPFLTFRMAWNRGVNFGVFSSDSDIMRWGLVIVAVAISAWLLSWARGFSGRVAQVMAGLVIGGAIGNALDRVYFGAVADFLNMSCCGLNNPYAFNIADVSIFIGAFGLVLFTNRDEN
jgi:signal peptidase II